jgi:uncharacterized repeat protein (TIGR01451 family)
VSAIFSKYTCWLVVVLLLTFKTTLMKKLLLTLTGLLCVFGLAFAQLTVTFTTTNVNCAGGNDGGIITTVTSGIAPYTYVWSNGSTTANLVNGPAGTYTITVTDNLGATVTGTATITEPPILTAFASGSGSSCITTFGSAWVSATGGTFPYTYFWSTGSNAPQVSGLAPGVYAVSVIDANGCAASDTVFIGQGTLNISVALVYDSCAGTACAVATAAGTSANYVWSNSFSGPTNCGLIDGTYSLTATDNFGCSATQTITVTNQPTLLLLTSTTPASCGNDGTAVLSVSGGAGPYTYLWSNGGTTPQVGNLPAGNYSVTVTDANGCIATETATVASGSFTILSLQATPETCIGAGNGSSQITVSGSNPPFSYQWSNGDTSNAITGLSAGVYIVTVTDNSGCILVQTTVVNNNSLQVNVDQISAANCIGSGGTLVATPQNGNAPFTYLWSNGSTTDTATGLPVGGHTVTVTDANGCSAVVHRFVTVDQGCYTHIGGRVYVDLDGDCSYTSGDLGLSGYMVSIQPGYYAYTNGSGVWSAFVPLGSYNAVVSQYGTGATLIDTCGIDTLLVNVVDTNTITGLDFPKTSVTPNNVGITVYCGVARPGFVQYNSVTISNYGVNAANVSGSIVLSSAVTDVPTFTLPAGITIDSVTYGPTTIYYSVTGLLPQQTLNFGVYVTLPLIPTVSLGQVLTHTGSINMFNATDQDLTNNTASCSTVIVGSYDPNDKQVFNASNESIDGPAMVEDTLLRYLIRFQNTGTDTAFNIVVRDTLDSDLNISSFRFIAASHNVEIEFYEERIVHFVFNNILLPDSNVNESLSHGFVEFDIEVLDKTQLEEVTNQAAIYFDFNPPIYTNTVATQRTVGIAERVTVPVNVFPNPTTGLLSVNVGGLPISAVELYDMMGRKVLIFLIKSEGPKPHSSPRWNFLKPDDLTKA